MKYLLKNTTQKTIWKKLIDAKPVGTKHSERQENQYVSSVNKNGIKLCTWSRNFDWKPFILREKHDGELTPTLQ